MMCHLDHSYQQKWNGYEACQTPSCMYVFVDLNVYNVQ